MNNSKINQNWILKKIFSIISKKGMIHRIYENYIINKYINKISN